MFYSNLGYEPKFNFTPKETIQNEEASHFIGELQELHNHLQLELEASSMKMKEFADRKRIAGPNYKIGDQVLLSTRNIRTNQNRKKLGSQRIGPFAIKRIINELTYELEIPKQYKIHPVFHTSLLEPFKANTIPGRIQAIPPPILINDEEEFEVENILDSKFQRKRLYYLVNWKGYPYSQNTWEPAPLQNSDRLVQEFHINNPTKPKPIR